MNSPITPDLVYQIKTAGEPSLSPDGSLLAYTLGWVDEENLSSRSKIMGLHIKGGALNELTEGTKDFAAKFSPDGTRLTFLRSVDDGPPQIWVMAVDGSDSKRVTDFEKGVFDYVWSPVGDQLAVCADVDPSSEGGDESDKVPQVTVVSRVRFRYDTLGWRGDAHYHLFVVDIESSESRQITDGDWDDTSPVWSPDGSQIAFMAGRRDDRDLLALNEAYIVPATGGEAELVSAGLASVGALTWAPDSQRLAVVGSDAPEGMVLWQGWLYVLEQDKEPRKLTDDAIRPYLGFPSVMRPATLHWDEDGQIIFLGEREGESFLYRAPSDGSPSETVWGGSCLSTALTLDRTSGLAVVAASTPNSPGDLYEIDLDIGRHSQLTDHNAEYMMDHPAANMEKFSVQRPGFDVECRLFFPPDFNESLMYPLVLDIHGGPNGAFYDSFVPVQQMLATTGYLVLAVNPRGSSTYG
ncbi:MAG: hypothetical protein VX213_07060, partial [Chloroflexota bacterium]|nr:hypothetical protein [Chloroflexota bacterium]